MARELARLRQSVGRQGRINQRASLGEVEGKWAESVELVNDRRLHSALGYQTPCRYETEFKRVIDSEIDLAQGLDVATEDRALRGRTSSADAALQTAGVAAYGQPTGPGPVPAGASPKRKIPGGSGDRVTRFLR
jgi:hypothetical protein